HDAAVHVDLFVHHGLGGQIDDAAIAHADVALFTVDAVGGVHDAADAQAKRGHDGCSEGRAGIRPAARCAPLVSPAPGADRPSSFTSLCTAPRRPDRAPLEHFDA